MAGRLDGKRIAVFTAPEGVEQVELTTRVERLTAEGAQLELVSFGAEQVQMFDHLDKADTKPVDVQLRGRTLTSWPSLQTDIRNAGGDWVDQEVVRDVRLVTSRKPDDLDAFCAVASDVFAEAGGERSSEDFAASA